MTSFALDHIAVTFSSSIENVGWGAERRLVIARPDRSARYVAGATFGLELKTLFGSYLVFNAANRA
jgi:hypothetical protein